MKAAHVNSIKPLKGRDLFLMKSMRVLKECSVKNDTQIWYLCMILCVTQFEKNRTC